MSDIITYLMSFYYRFSVTYTPEELRNMTSLELHDIIHDIIFLTTEQRVAILCELGGRGFDTSK